MKKIEKILLTTVFFCILSAGNLFALSPEAKATIEEIRIRLFTQESIQGKSKQSFGDIEEYIPGKELAEALSRYRMQVYSSRNRKDWFVQSDRQNPKATTLHEIEKPNSAFVIPPSFDSNIDAKLEAITAKQAPYELKNVEARKAEESNSTADTKKAIVRSEKTYIPGQLLSISIMRIRHSQRRETPAGEELDKAIAAYELRLAQKKSRNSKELIDKATQEIEEIFNNPEKRAKTAKAKRQAVEAQKATTDQDSNEIDDKKFNDYISRYDFKMPENYRILVE